MVLYLHDYNLWTEFSDNCQSQVFVKINNNIWLAALSTSSPDLSSTTVLSRFMIESCLHHQHFPYQHHHWNRDHLLLLSVGIQLTVSSSFNVYILVLFGIVETSWLVSTNSIAVWKYRPITSLVWRNKRFKMLINDQTNNETWRFFRWWSSIGLHMKSRVEQSSKDDDVFYLSHILMFCVW